MYNLTKMFVLLLSGAVVSLIAPSIASSSEFLQFGPMELFAPLILLAGLFVAYYSAKDHIDPCLPAGSSTLQVATYGLICGVSAGTLGGLTYGYHVDQNFNPDSFNPDLFQTALIRVLVASMTIGTAVSVLLTISVNLLSTTKPIIQQNDGREIFGVIIFSFFVGGLSVYILANVGQTAAWLANLTGQSIDYLSLIGRGRCQTNTPYIKDGSSCDIGDISLLEIGIILVAFLLFLMPFVVKIFNLSKIYWSGFLLFAAVAVIWLGVVGWIQTSDNSLIYDRKSLEHGSWVIIFALVPALLLLGWFVFAILKMIEVDKSQGGDESGLPN